MTEKRMLILPAEVVEKVNANRGDMSQADFISFLIDGHLNQEPADQSFVTQEALEGYVTQEALEEFEQGTKELLRSFMEFFVSYGLEVDRRPNGDDTEALSHKLQGLEKKPKA